MRSFALHCHADCSVDTWASMLRMVCSTPLGFPVVPEVYTIRHPLLFVWVLPSASISLSRVHGEGGCRGSSLISIT